MKKSAKWLAACSAAMILSASHAHAQSGAISATLDGSDPLASTSIFHNGAPNCQPQIAPAVRIYEVRSITVTATGSYVFADNFSGRTADGIFGIYTGAFNPADIAQNCVLGIDDGAFSTPNGSGVTLTQGVAYNMWFTTFDPNTQPQTVGVTYTGPGTIAEGAPAAAVPTLSEWAMILFGVVLAGGAALYIQRRKLVA